GRGAASDPGREARRGTREGADRVRGGEEVRRPPVRRGPRGRRGGVPVTDVRPFVTSYLEAIGARVRPLPTGGLAVTWPPTHVGKFGDASSLAFDPAVAEVSKADLCVVGSDLLDKI